MCELCNISKLFSPSCHMLLTQYSDATHTARDVSEDPMIGEIAASLVVCRTTASDRLGIPAQTATGFAPRPPEHGQAQVMPPQVAQTTPSGAAAPTEDEEGGPTGCGPPEATTDDDMFSTRLERTARSTPATTLPHAGSRASPDAC